MLLAALAARGAPYEVVATHVTNDLEAPALFPDFTCCFEVRLTDREVILARTGHRLKLSNAQEGTFVSQVQFTVPGAAEPYVERRGWLSVDARKGGHRFRFITTHLLPDGLFDPIQVLQGQELVTGPADTPLPVILVCDCNSRADGTGTDTYADLLGAGFDDAWAERHPHRPGFTCCQAEDLRNSPSLLDQRIDLVLIRGRARVERAFRVGAREGEKTEAGLWPSDHAGVVATFKLK
jgi:endonuclease/exonuclease/phosphatase family metal-dependent hydrolase